MNKISDSMLRRLPKYIYLLTKLKDEKYISATKISKMLNFNKAQVRKDFLSIGMRGKPRVGHEINVLMEGITNFLNWNKEIDAFLIGVGSLGTALINYKDFEDKGFKIVAGFEKNPEKIGNEINNIKILSISKLPQLVKRMKVKVAIICTPEEQVKKIYEDLRDSGIKAVWNLTSYKIVNNDDVIVENLDLNSSIAIITGKLK